MGVAAQRAGGAAGQAVRATNASNLATAAEGAIIAQGAARAETIADALANAGIVTGRVTKLAGPAHLLSQQISNQQPQRESPTPVENKYFNGKTRLWGDKEVPRDKHTILKNDKSFIKTNYENQGATVYKKGKYYYCRDQFHCGDSAHLEVFNKRGKHVGKANPITGEIDFTKAEPGRTTSF